MQCSEKLKINILDSTCLSQHFRCWISWVQLERLNKDGFFWKVCQQKTSCLQNKNMAAWLRFTKLHLDKPQNFWNSVFWIDKTKVEIFGQNAQTALQSLSRAFYSRGNVRPSFRELKLGPNWVIQQNNEPKHNSKVQTSTHLKICSCILKELCINECPQPSVDWSNAVKNSGPKSNVRDKKQFFSRYCC